MDRILSGISKNKGDHVGNTIGFWKYKGSSKKGDFGKLEDVLKSELFLEVIGSLDIHGEGLINKSGETRKNNA